MTKATFTIYDNDRAIFVGEDLDSAEKERIWFDGVLQSPRVFTVDDPLKSYRIVMSVRESQRARVTLAYTGRTEVYEVTFGRPLSIESQPEEGAVALQTVTVENIATPVDCAFLLYEGEKEPLVLDSEPELSLNASTGVEIDVQSRVTQWSDQRLGSVVAGLFTPPGSGPTYVPAHNAFNGKPAVSFGEELGVAESIPSERLEYQGPASDLDVIAGDNDFTVTAVVQIRERGEKMAIFSTLDGSSAGFEFGTRSGHRARVENADDVGTQGLLLQGGNNYLRWEASTNPRVECCAVVITYRAASKQTIMKIQGQTLSLAATLSGTSVTAALCLGGTPLGTQAAVCAIADFRIYNYVLTDEQVDDYILFSETEYAAVNETRVQPYPDLKFRLLPGQSITLSSNEVVTWSDPRDDSDYPSDFAPLGSDPGPDDPRFFYDETIANNHPFIFFEPSRRPLIAQGAAAEWDRLLGGGGDFSVIFYIRGLIPTANLTVDPLLGNTDRFSSGWNDGFRIAARETANQLPYRWRAEASVQESAGQTQVRIIATRDDASPIPAVIIAAWDASEKKMELSYLTADGSETSSAADAGFPPGTTSNNLQIGEDVTLEVLEVQIVHALVTGNGVTTVYNYAKDRFDIG